MAAGGLADAARLGDRDQQVEGPEIRDPGGQGHRHIVGGAGCAAALIGQNGPGKLPVRPPSTVIVCPVR